MISLSYLPSKTHILIVKLRRNGGRRCRRHSGLHKSHRAVAPKSSKGRILLNSRSKVVPSLDRELTLAVVIYSFMNSGGQFPKSIRRKGRGYTRLCYSLPQICRSSCHRCFRHFAQFNAMLPLRDWTQERMKW
jgi:hypothetical protein